MKGCSPYCCETVESADIYVVVGGIFNDYSSAGYSMLLKRSKMIEVRDPCAHAHVMAALCVVQGAG